jgi:hypothetical protein
MDLNGSHVHISVPTSRYLELIEAMESAGEIRRPEQVIDLAIHRWILSSADELSPLVTKATDEAEVQGYFWKRVFLPSGTRLRMRYRGEYHHAVVEGDRFIWRAKESSPAQFANGVTRTMRNAWRDLELLRPGDQTWVPAADIRKQVDAMLDALTLEDLEL